MLAKTLSLGLYGIEGYVISVEVDVSKGMPAIDIVGLPDTAVKESKERVRAAIKNSGFHFFPMRILINLSPADTKKEGTLYDLPIALGILAASGQIDGKLLEGKVFLGELGLDGAIGKVEGLLPMLIEAKQAGIKTAIIPKPNEQEAMFISDLDVYALNNLSSVVKFLQGQQSVSKIQYVPLSELKGSNYSSGDFKLVKGQIAAKRALEIAAAGGHNVLMVGPPGSGKTMLARCLPSILPEMTESEILEATKIHSVAGKLDITVGIVNSRPFRTPHHTASTVSLTGGGSKAKPGEISLAHCGVLFLDEMPEYTRSALESLRQPLEDGVITIARVVRTVDYPANFILVGSMNPCPCGNFGSIKNECKCTPRMIDKYSSKLSGPLLDRIDLHIEIDELEVGEILSTEIAEESSVIRKRVCLARDKQTERFKGTNLHSNSQMKTQEVRDYCRLDKDCEDVLTKAIERLKLSARAYDRILKVARTIADLDNSVDIQKKHIAEAVQYRSMDRKYKFL